MKKLLISTFAAAVMLLFGGVNEVNGDPLSYKAEGNSVTITDCETSAKGALVIPSSYNGKPVTAIGDSAFYNCDDLTSVTIPDSVTRIEYHAFASCSSLTSVTIPDSVTSIGGYAFAYNGSLTSIEVVEGNSEYTSQDGVLFDKNKTILIQYPKGKQSGHYSIPDSVISIGRGGFYSCSSLTSVTIPDSVTSIGVQAFRYCRSLTSVTIPDSVTSIGGNAFEGCSSLTSIGVVDGNNVYTSQDGGLIDKNKAILIQYPEGKSGHYTIPDSVTSIGHWAFAYCSSLTSVTIPDSVTIIGVFAFYNCSSLTSVTIPDSVTSIGTSAFAGCSSLTSVTIPDSVTSIGSSAFAGCSSLTSVTIPDSVTSIGKYAFRYCSSLTSVTIPNSVTSIGEKAFAGAGLTEVTIPNQDCFIADDAFDSSVNITGAFSTDPLTYEVVGDTVTIKDCKETAFGALVIPSSYNGKPVTAIGDSAFADCSSLTSVTIPDSVTSIGDSAFADCSSLTSVTIPDSVISIGDWAFAGCSSLTSVTIPNSVISIGDWAFGNCVDLTSIGVVEGNSEYTSQDGVLFDKNKTVLILYPAGKSGHYTIPDSVTSIGDSGFYSCRSLTSVTIPDSVTSIGKYAFRYCRSLTSVTIPDSVISIGEVAFESCSSQTYFEVSKGNAKYSSEDGVLFDKNKTILIQFPAGKSGHYTTPDSVTSIGDWAFAYCSSLASVKIPDSVTNIGFFAFFSCSSLTSVTIPYSVIFIGLNAFAETGLTEVTIPNPNTAVYDNAFDSSVNVSVALFSAPLTYLVQNNTITVTDCKTSASGAMQIPSSCNGYPVNAIGDRAFESCSSLTSVTIPDSVTSIGKYAFRYCGSLTSVTIPNSVTSIGEKAFAGTGLTEVTIPNSNAMIADDAFDSSVNITGAFSTDPLTYKVEGNSVTITDCETSAKGALVIPSSYNGKPVTAIGDKAFADCSSLTSVTIPDSVTSIRERAFAGTKLTEVIIPNPDCVIADDAFDSSATIIIGKPESDPLTYLVEGNSVTITDCDENASGTLVIPSSYQGKPVTKIGDQAFRDCSSLASVTITDSVTSIGGFAFRYCSSLTSVTIPDSVISIGNYAFGNCSSLTSIGVVEGNSEYTSQDGVLFDKNKTVLIQYPAGKQSGHYTIPDSVTSIGNAAFMECSSLKSVTIPDSVTSIGGYSFAYCRSLTSVTIGNSVTSIGGLAFGNCRSLTSVTIPNSVISIGEKAFAGTGLTEVTIPNSNAMIADDAFDSSVAVVGSELGWTGLEGSDHRFKIFGSERLASIESRTLFEETNTNVSYTQALALSRRVYEHFNDDFDFIIFASNQPDVPSGSYYGMFYNVQNNFEGIGKEIFDYTTSFGSKGRLQGVIHLPSIWGLSGGPSIHEIAHNWAHDFKSVPTEVGGHWGYSNIGGQLGGWQPGSLVELGDNKYKARNPNTGEFGSWGSFANGGNGLPYSEFELYTMGLIEASDVGHDIKIAKDFKWVDPRKGIFSASEINTVTMDEVVEIDGLRSPGPSESQKEFSILYVILTDKPLTLGEWQKFDEDVHDFQLPADNGSSLYNFWEATRGLATLKMDELAESLKVKNAYAISIVEYLREPFGFGFESQRGRSYVVEATGDLKEWGVVKTYNGTGTLIRFEEVRDQLFPQIYYRVKVIE